MSAVELAGSALVLASCVGVVAIERGPRGPRGHGSRAGAPGRLR